MSLSRSKQRSLKDTNELCLGLSENTSLIPLIRPLLPLIFLISCTHVLIACDDSDQTKNQNDAGEEAAGEAVAGEVAAGETVAGEVAAGEAVAGEVAAGEAAAGEVVAGEVAAGEVVAGEEVAGEVAAGEAVAGEATAGEMTEMSGAYAPNTVMSDLTEEGQRAFCEAFVARDQEAGETISEADQAAFREASCYVAGLLSGAMDEASCEAARAQCLTDFDNTMFTVESCLMDFASAFTSCGATVSEIEACEVATRELLLTSMLDLPQNLQSCSNAGNPVAGIQLVSASLRATRRVRC